MLLREMFDRVWMICHHDRYHGLVKRLWRFSSEAEANRGSVLLAHADTTGAYFPVTQTLSGTWLVLRVTMSGDLHTVKLYPIYAIGVTRESAEKAAAKAGAPALFDVFNIALEENPSDEAE